MKQDTQLGSTTAVNPDSSSVEIMYVKWPISYSKQLERCLPSILNNVQVHCPPPPPPPSHQRYPTLRPEQTIVYRIIHQDFYWDVNLILFTSHQDAEDSQVALYNRAPQNQDTSSDASWGVGGEGGGCVGCGGGWIARRLSWFGSKEGHKSHLGHVCM